MIFVDSNIPMYLIGTPHPHKTEAQVLLERFIAAGGRLVTEAEVLQEVLHRCTAIDRREAIGPAFQVVLDIVDDVYGIERADVLQRDHAGAGYVPQIDSDRITANLEATTNSDSLKCQFESTLGYHERSNSQVQEAKEEIRNQRTGLAPQSGHV